METGGSDTPGTPRPVETFRATRDEVHFTRLSRRIQPGMRLQPRFLGIILYEPQTFLYVRARTTLEHANDALDAIAEKWESLV